MAKFKQDEDLFQDSTMTFGEHIEELRRYLWRAILGSAIGIAIGFYFGTTVVEFIQLPLVESLNSYYRNQAQKQIKERYADQFTDEMLEIILQRGMVPDFVSIEPNNILDELRKVGSPGLQVPELPHFPFTSADLTEPKKLAETLVDQGPVDAPSPAAQVWKLLSSEQQTAVQELAETEEPTTQQIQALAAAIDALLGSGALYDEQAFASAGPSSSLTKRYETARTENVPALREDNWTLLALAFPGQIVAPHPLLVPTRIWRSLADDPRTKVKTLNAQEAFMIWMKASFILGLIIASPWIFWQLWQFVAAGLYPHEKKYVYIFLPFSMVLFWAGAALAFFAVFHFVLEFLFSFNASLGIEPDPRINEWLSFALFLPLGFGIAFQLPLVMLFLERIGIFSVAIYIQKLRVAILVIAFLSMILTPADPMSMLLMLVPLVALYFLGIALCKWMPRSRSPFGDASEIE